MTARWDRARGAIVTVLRYSVLAAALGYLGTYVVLACLRLAYPFELEWMEGGSVDHVARLLRGEGLYVPPRLEFVPYQYPPLYFHLSALVARVTGLGFLPLRAVSFAASLLCFVAIYELVRTESGSRFSAIVATGLFAATFRIGGAWLDIARVDSLFLALFLLALLVVRRRHSAGAYVVAGLLFALSFLTKQTALAMCLPVIAAVVLSAPRLGAWLAGSAVTVVAASTAVLHWASGGWYTFYVLRFPFLYPLARPVFLTFWTRDLLAHLPVASIAAVLCLAGPLRSRGGSLFWLMTAAGMVGGAYRSRLQTGGYDNVLLPAYAIIAILFGLGLAAWLRLGGEWDARRRQAAHVAIYAGCLGQMIGLVYDPRAALPRSADRRAGERLLQVVSGLEGDVFIPYHGHLAALAGKRSYAHGMPVYDVIKVGLPESAPLAEEHRAAIRERRFGAIILDDRQGYVFMPEIEASYSLEGELFADPKVFFPVTGVPTRPQYLYVPRSPRSAAGPDVPPGSR